MLRQSYETQVSYRIPFTSISYPNKYGHLKSSCPSWLPFYSKSSVITQNILVTYAELLSKLVWALQEDQFHFLIITLSILRVLPLCFFHLSSCFQFPFSLTSLVLKQEEFWVQWGSKHRARLIVIESPGREGRLARFTRLWPLNKACLTSSF